LNHTTQTSQRRGFGWPEQIWERQSETADHTLN
jgi:hypothetical protein